MMGYTVVAVSLVALKMCMLVYLLAEYFENVHNCVCFCVKVRFSYWFIYGNFWELGVFLNWTDGVGKHKFNQKLKFGHLSEQLPFQRVCPLSLPLVTIGAVKK